jgi:predicted metal-dependent hydrolase
MAFKKFVLDERTEITVYKRRSNRSLRLSVASNGEVRVTIPVWAPYQSGVNFAKSRHAWIIEQSRGAATLKDGQAVGKAHHLQFVPTSSAKPTSRLQGNQIIVRYPFESQLDDPAVQKVAVAACERALRQQAEQLLPGRLASLAEKHDFTYTSVTIKKLKSRWGSCDQRRNIVLNLYLMNLPWEVIDYVLLHELTHTIVLRHGTDFWQALARTLPNYKDVRKMIRNFQPAPSSISPQQAEL